MLMIKCLFVIVNVIMYQSTPYFIEKTKIPSFLYRKFDVVEEEQFPIDIGIDVALSRVVGTLVYSLDRNTNQFIVTLRDNEDMDIKYVIEVVLNTQVKVVSLSKLCSSKNGTFNILDELKLRIQINDSITLQCNGGNVERYKNKRMREINNYYPINLFSASNRTMGQKNAAHLWLVNYPIYPNGLQMYGCIFDVLYRDKSIEFTNISNIVPNCKKACTNDMCNGGECLVLYSSETVCNCTITFQNGRLCSNEMRTQNIRAIKQSILMKIFKLSWNSDSNEIMELKNEKVRIAISRQGSNLSFEYDYNDDRNKSNKILLSNNYKPNMNTTCLVYLSKNHADIRLFNNFLWETITFDYLGNFGDEKFNTIVLRSGKGVIEVVTKNQKEDHWNEFNIRNPKNIDDISTSHSIIISVTLTLIILFGSVISVITFLYCRRKRRQLGYHATSDNDGNVMALGITQYIRRGEIIYTVDQMKDMMKRRNEAIFSPEFYSHENGYKVKLGVYPGGNNIHTEYLIVCIRMCNGDYDSILPWPCRHTFDVAIVNQRTNCILRSETCSYNIYRKSHQKNQQDIGHRPLMSHCQLQSVDDVIVRDSIVLKCIARSPIIIDTNYFDKMSETTIKVDSFSDRMNYVNSLIISPPFYSHENGYRVKLHVYPGGSYEIRTHMAVFIQICKGDNDDSLSWPFRHSFNVVMVNQQNNCSYISTTFSYDNSDNNHLHCFDKPKFANNDCIKFRSFISHSDLRSIIVNDCIILKCIIRAT